jgi:hypothetical protein
MRLYQALYKYLQTQAPVTALVGTRVYDAHADQGRATKYPCIVVEMIDDQQFHSIGAVPTATRRPVNFYCMAQGNGKASDDLADIVYAAIMGSKPTKNFTRRSWSSTLFTTFKEQPWQF